MRAIKKLLSVFLIIATCFLTACSSKGNSATINEIALENDSMTVDSPMVEKPNYTFDHKPTIDEMRQMAVKAMRDELSVQWFTEETFTYNKGGAASDKTYIFKEGIRYAGLPYTDVNTSLFGFLEYYDQNSGRLDIESIRSSYADLGAGVNATIGNTCTGSTCWALLSVCNSIKGGMVSYYLVQKNGFYPVGNYTYDSYITDFLTVTTDSICAATGQEQMWNCYKEVLPADLLVQQGTDRSTGHSIMAIEPAHVEYLENGKIDGENSYIMIQDQRTGFYALENDMGHKINYSGRISYKASFAELFRQNYIPVTTAEFKGEKEYEEGTVKLNSENQVISVEDMKSVSVLSNYPMAVLKLIAADENGKRNTVKSKVFNRDDIKSNSAYKYSLNSMAAILQSYELKSGKYNVTVEVTLSTGQVFTPVSFEYKVK